MDYFFDRPTQVAFYNIDDDCGIIIIAGGTVGSEDVEYGIYTLDGNIIVSGGTIEGTDAAIFKLFSLFLLPFNKC